MRKVEFVKILLTDSKIYSKIIDIKTYYGVQLRVQVRHFRGTITKVWVFIIDCIFHKIKGKNNAGVMNMMAETVFFHHQI